MAKFKVMITAYIDAKDEAEAIKQSTVIDKGLKHPLLAIALKGDGVKVASYSVGKPIKEG